MLSDPRWRTELGWFFIARAPPLLVDDVVVARCGHSIVALARSDGAVQWRSDVEPECGDGEFFLPLAGGGWVTDFHRQPERLTSVVAIGKGGARLWRADLPAIAGGRAIVRDGERILLPAKQPRSGQRLLVFDAPASHGTFTNHALAWGVSRMELVGGVLVVATAFGGEAGHGLYRMARDGSGPIALATPSAIDVAKVDEVTVVAVMKEGKEITVAAIDIDGSRRWSAPASAQWVAVAGGRSITVEDRRPVCRDARSGDVLWTGDVLTGETNSIGIAGDLAIVAAGRSRAVLEMMSGRCLGHLPTVVGAVAVDEDALYLAADRSVFCYPRS